MDFLSDNLVFGVFIVIAIALQIGRLFIGRARERKRRERGSQAGGRPAPAVYRERYENDENKDEDEDEAENEGGGFSAWDLSVEDEAGGGERTAAPAAAPFPAAAPRPLSAAFPDPFPAPAVAPLFPALAAGPAWGAERPETDGLSPASAPGAGASIESRAGGRGKGRAGFPEKLGRLPPLQRAVVLAEILGRPRGF
jgi:hypothetical protein